MAIPPVGYERHPETVLGGLEKGACVVFRCDCEQWYLPDKPLLELLVMALADQQDRRVLKLVVTRFSSAAEQALSDLAIGEGASPAKALSTLASVWQVPVINLAEPLGLEPVAIAKPWGQEIWYTGMEQRGLSLVTDGRRSIPLAWLAAIFPTYLMGATSAHGPDSGGAVRTPNLLKILDPLPEPVYGDLYFELHEKKREVYVVSHIDKQAWPEGVGAIRYGFSSTARGRYNSESEFRSAYLKAVSAYRLIRKQLDDCIDEMRSRDNIDLNEAVSVEQAKIWAGELPEELSAQEALLRAEMDSFTELRPLRLGDVVKVPLLTPHALQHGVRTVEFQTPVYERKILSFAQKVLTQKDWDTAEAMELMPPEAEQPVKAEAPAQAVVGELADIDGGTAVRHEQIVVFEDFHVQRITLNSKAVWTLPVGAAYSLVMTLQGVLDINGREVRPEQAVFVPSSCQSVKLRSLAAEPCVVLISQPGSPGSPSEK